MSQKSQMAGLETEIPEEDILRADLYATLARLLAAPPDQDLIDMAAGLSGDASDLGQGIASLATVAKSMSAKAVER